MFPSVPWEDSLAERAQARVNFKQGRTLVVKREVGNVRYVIVRYIIRPMEGVGGDISYGIKDDHRDLAFSRCLVAGIKRVVTRHGFPKP